MRSTDMADELFGPDNAAAGAAGFIGWLALFQCLPTWLMVCIGIAGITGMVKFGCNTRGGKQLVPGVFGFLLMSFLMSGGIRLLERIAGRRGMAVAMSAGFLVYAAVTVFLGVQERQQLAARGMAAESAAACFAAKEAFGKALGGGVRGFSLAEVQLLRAPSGRAPYS